MCAGAAVAALCEPHTCITCDTTQSILRLQVLLVINTDSRTCRCPSESLIHAWLVIRYDPTQVSALRLCLQVLLVVEPKLSDQPVPSERPYKHLV